jgi:hypothetical protein
MLPADLSQQVEQRLHAILGGGEIVHADLRSLMAECIRRADNPRDQPNSPPARVARRGENSPESTLEGRNRAGGVRPDSPGADKVEAAGTPQAAPRLARPHSARLPVWSAGCDLLRLLPRR